MRVLGIDTAGPLIGAALWSPDAVLSWSERIVRGADGRLLPGIEGLLLQGEAPELVAVSVGPGSFTSLRVGVATALGLAVALGLKVVPMSSLLARAALVPGEPRVLALLDARKGRVYGASFDTTGAVPFQLSDEVDLDPLQVVGPWPTVGEGAVAFRDMVEQAGGRVVDAAQASPAAQVARLAAGLAERALDPGQVALHYLRPPDAQIPKDLRPS